MKLEMSEIFYSIQGEGAYSGYPFIIVRFSGCNLDCSYCDAHDALKKGKIFSINQVINTIKELPSVDKVLITGGEPLLQKDGLLALIGKLLKEKRRVFLETNGSQDVGVLPGNVIKIIDVKTPSSGYPDSFLLKNINYISPDDELKFIIGSDKDFNFSIEFILRNKLARKCNLVFSPVYKKLEEKQLAEWILKAELPIRFSIQLHKYLGMK